MKKFLILIVVLTACKQQQQQLSIYSNQIGDTKFKKKIDNPNFKLCDEENVLHRRSKVVFKGGHKSFYKKLNDSFNDKTIDTNFTVFFVIRFVVNCSNDIGRLRWDILDNNFKKSNCSKYLENHLVNCVRKIRGWQHPVIEAKNYDGYTFIPIKFINGKIIL